MGWMRVRMKVCKGVVSVAMSALSLQLLPGVFEDKVWASLSLLCSCRVIGACCQSLLEV